MQCEPPTDPVKSLCEMCMRRPFFEFVLIDGSRKGACSGFYWIQDCGGLNNGGPTMEQQQLQQATATDTAPARGIDRYKWTCMICLSTCLSMYLSVCVHVYLHVCLSGVCLVSVSVCLLVHLSSLITILWFPTLPIAKGLQSSVLLVIPLTDLFLVQTIVSQEHTKGWKVGGILKIHHGVRFPGLDAKVLLGRHSLEFLATRMREYGLVVSFDHTISLIYILMLVQILINTTIFINE
jgi:hypothetical protein